MTNPSPLVVSAVAKARRHLVPLLFLLGLICLLDRASVGYAALTMNADLGLSAAAYGIGAGIFFLGYVIFEVPSNLILQRIGAKVWIARIGITWGLVMLFMAFIWDEWSFYAARLLLGLAEAGLFPAVYFLIGQWFPNFTKGRVLALFLSCNAVSGIIMGPLASAIFTLSAPTPFADWRVLFFVLGVPAIVLGFVAYAKLPNAPREARWLTTDEQDALVAAIAAEQRAAGVTAETHSIRGLTTAIKRPFVWAMTAVFFFFAMANYGVILFLPQVVERLAGTAPALSALLSSIPYVLGLISLIVVAASSDRRMERRWHFAVPALVGAAGLFATGMLLDQPIAGFLALCVAVIGVMPLSAILMSRPTAVLAGTTAAAGIAFINALGSLGGFFGPYVVGFFQEVSASFVGGLVVLSASLLIAAIITIGVRAREERSRSTTEPELAPSEQGAHE